MQPWIGPAIVAAVISSLISAVGWFVTYRLNIASDDRRRREKIRDFQIALRAEIRSELQNLSRFDLQNVLADVERRYARQRGYSVIVPRLANAVVSDEIASEIHILPEAAIGPVVYYIRQRRVVEAMAEDMRSQSFVALPKERQLAMYKDYLGMWKVWRDMAGSAETALTAEINSLDPVR